MTKFQTRTLGQVPGKRQTSSPHSLASTLKKKEEEVDESELQRAENDMKGTAYLQSAT